MTRSLNTDPPDIRAARRLAAPRRARRDEPSALRHQARLRAALGLDPSPLADPADGAPVQVSIRVTSARPGFVHPLGRGEIARALAFFGPLATYGLRSVVMRHAVGAGSAGTILARLRVPGLVILYEQPEPPWSVRDRLSGVALDRLRRSGAIVDIGPAATRIDWPGNSFRDFMLFDGLMHEIGHHLIQQHRGKREARVMRTADQEHRADAFARSCREAWESPASSP